MSGLIIREVASKYLNIQPEILGHIAHDVAVEAAVNLMIPFPLDKDESPPARDLRHIAQKVLELSSQRGGGYEAQTQSAPVAEEDEDWGSLLQRGPV